MRKRDLEIMLDDHKLNLERLQNKYNRLSQIDVMSNIGNELYVSINKERGKIELLKELIGGNDGTH